MVRELPRHEAVEALDGRRRHRSGVAGLAVVAAEHRDPDRAVVVARSVRPYDGPVDTASTALEHAAEPVDEEVVADVVPSQRVRVVAVDAPQDRRDVLPGVVVAGRGVMHHSEPGCLGVVRAPAPPGLVSSPLGPPDDVGAERDGVGRSLVAREHAQRGQRGSRHQGTGQAGGVHEVGAN